MNDSLPLACSLSAEQLPQRLTDVRAVGRAALISVERNQSRAVLRFDPGRPSRAELERIVAAESSCCAFLRLELSDEPSAAVLTIEAPPGGEPVMHELIDAFAGDAQVTR